MTRRQEEILARMMVIIRRHVVPEADWGWGPDGELGYIGPELPFNMQGEVSDFATASCLPDLWALRAYGARVSIPVRTTDWWFYNRI